MHSLFCVRAEETSFPESAPAGYFSQVTWDHFISGCPVAAGSHQLFTGECLLSSALCSAAEIHYRSGGTSSSLIRVFPTCTGLHTPLVHTFVWKKGRESERWTDKTREFTEKEGAIGRGDCCRHAKGTNATISEDPSYDAESRTTRSFFPV